MLDDFDDVDLEGFEVRNFLYRLCVVWPDGRIPPGRT